MTKKIYNIVILGNIIAAFLLISCGESDRSISKDLSKKIIGSWNNDSGAQIDFLPDGIGSYTSNYETNPMSWQIEDGDTLRLNNMPKGASSATRLVFESECSMLWIDPGGLTVRLSRIVN